MMPTVSRERLAEVLVEMADTLIDDFDLIEFLHTVTVRTAELIDVAAVGLLLADHHGQLQVMSASDEQTKLLELFQVQHHEGPRPPVSANSQASDLRRYSVVDMSH
jgi:hypothetical protein